MRRALCSLPAAAFCCAIAAVQPAAAAGFPQKPVRLVVGYAPGGGADVLARVLARRLSERWTQPVVVENRAGAGGTIAAAMVAGAPPDGYTLLLITTNHTVPSAEYPNTSYDPIKSFTPVVEIAQIPGALVVSPSIRVNTVKELIDLAREKPGALNFGSTGPGTAQFMDMHLLMQSVGIKMINVTYKGAGPILIALLGNEIQVTLSPITAFLESIRAGKLKALGVTGKVRSQLLPNVPTYAESAVLRGFEGSANWYGIVAPARTSKTMADRLHDDVVAGLDAPEVQRLLSEQGFIRVAGTPDQFTKRIVDDLAKWSKVLKTLDTR